MKVNELVKNPFVIAGGIGLLVYVFMKMQDKKEIVSVSTPTTRPMENIEVEEKEVVEDTTSKFDGLPEDFFKDVEKMSKEEVKHTIKLNSGLAKRKNLKKAEKDRINLMLQYLKEKYAQK
jgi:hypothetical protein|tara:strand:- start:19905 stop:20264 length:360 start_codon:yes stop_codon:yes gene_type:complete